jgi:hypothetical protein
VSLLEHNSEGRYSVSLSDLWTTWHVAGSDPRTQEGGDDVWTHPASWTASLTDTFFQFECPRAFIRSTTGAGAAGAHGPGARSTEILVVRVNPRDRTYSVALTAASTFEVTLRDFDPGCSGAVIGETRQRRSPATDTAVMGVRPFPEDFEPGRRLVGSASAVSGTFNNHRVTITWDLRFDYTWDRSRDEPEYDIWPPNTSLEATPPKTTRSRRARFALAASELGGATFECSLDGRAWTRCAAQHTYRGLSRGRHVFRARATDARGNVETTPARYTWRITR